MLANQSEASSTSSSMSDVSAVGCNRTSDSSTCACMTVNNQSGISEETDQSGTCSGKQTCDSGCYSDSQLAGSSLGLEKLSVFNKAKKPPTIDF